MLYEYFNPHLSMPPELPVVTPRETHQPLVASPRPTSVSPLASARINARNIRMDQGCGAHRTDRDLITILRAVLAENPYQVPKVERGPVWRRVIKRLSKDGLCTNTKVIRQRLRRNLRAYHDRKDLGGYRAASSLDAEKDALLDRLEEIAKQGVLGGSSSASKSTKVSASCSMAPGGSLIGRLRGNVIDWKGDKDHLTLIRSPVSMVRVSPVKEPYSAPKVLKVMLPSQSPESNDRPAWSSNNEMTTNLVTGRASPKIRCLDRYDTSESFMPGKGVSVADDESIPHSGAINFSSSGPGDNEDDGPAQYLGRSIADDRDNGLIENSPHEEHGDDERYMSSEDGDSEMRSEEHGIDMEYRDWDAENGGALRRTEATDAISVQQIDDFRRPSSRRRTFVENMSSASISEDEPCQPLNSNHYPDMSLQPYRFRAGRTDLHTELQRIDLWREEISLAKQRFAEEQARRKHEEEISSAREKFEREMAVQRLAFEAEQRDKDREAEMKRQMLQMKCQSEMQEMQIRAQQDQTRLMLEMIKLLRPVNGHG